MMQLQTASPSRDGESAQDPPVLFLSSGSVPHLVKPTAVYERWGGGEKQVWSQGEKKVGDRLVRDQDQAIPVWRHQHASFFVSSDCNCKESIE